MKTLKDFVLKNKKVLLRSDINSDVLDKKVLPSERIKEAAETINYLIKNKAKVVVIAHQGNFGKEDFLSLKQHAKLLNKYTKIRFVDDIIGEKAVSSINKLRSGEAILLNNIRFIEDEMHPEKENNAITKTLSPLFDLYVNDAFSVCHRAQTSVVSFPKYLPSCAGLLLEKEIKSLEKISIKDCLYILGGAKPEENIKLLRGKKVLACGLFAQLCLVADGKDLGYQNEFLKKATLVKGNYYEFVKKLKTKLVNVETPVDFAVSFNKKRKEFDLDEFPLNYEIEDIGKKTLEKYLKIIKKAPAIYMKGPAGNTSKKEYAKGTYEILKAVSNCKGFTVIGGGHLSDAIKNSKINTKKFGHISLSGGALLNYIAGEKLPGLESLG
ncbi:Phosphoglycerate kinase [uncultured archaeon]|nr:Phosphoglycerate kinase [uncultured archaeon]